MNSTKPELRKLLKTSRLALGKEARQAKSAVIRSRLREAVDWSKIVAVHCFEPIEELGEVQVTGFIENVQLFTSRQIDNEWKIVATDGNSPIPEQFDAIIVPMLGFDKNLQRIGYGGGYYDKFLATQPSALKIGVCFEIGKIDHVPAEAHDIQLDLVVTEDKTYHL